MNRVIISPYSRPLRNGKRNPKNYPFWPEVIKVLQKKKAHVVQIGTSNEERFSVNEYVFDASFKELEELLKISKTWVAVDNFFQHFCCLLGRPGVVIFGRSDPKIFGHEMNENLLKDRSYLRPAQFNFWEEVEYSEDCFVGPKVVAEAILRRVSNGN